MSAFEFAPFKNAKQDPLFQFRDMYRDVGLGTYAHPPLVTFAAIGADYDPSVPRLHVRDMCWLAHTFDACIELGIPVTSNFRVLASDLNHGQDVLAPGFGMKADALISCFIVDPDSPFGKAAKEMSDRVTGFRTSPYHSPASWKRLAQTSDAKMIVTFSRANEICAKHFISSDYVRGPSEVISIPTTDDVSPLYNMEMVFRKDFAQHLRL